MFEAYHLCGGGASVYKRYKLAATVSNPGVLLIMTATTGNISPSTTTSAADCIGLGVDTATYSETQATLLTAGTDALVTCSIRPDLVVGAVASGAATEGTALVVCTNTSASAGGTTITAANVAAADMDGGTAFCTYGANVGQSRTITTHTASTSFVVTVPFLRTIAVGDIFIMLPWNNTGTATGGNDGIHSVQATTNLYQANSTIASGTGMEATVVELIMKNTTETQVLFQARDHVYGYSTV